MFFNSILLADSIAPFQVGPTGFWAEWNGGSSSATDGDDYVTVTSVSAGGPADDVIQVGDKIFAANGTDLKTGTLQLYQLLRKDPRPILGNAITESEAGNGLLVLDIERGGTRQDITLQLLITNTAYSATWPENCPKTDLILQDTIDWVIGRFEGESKPSRRVFAFGSLILLAMDDEQYHDELKAAMDRQFGTTDVVNTGSEGGQRTLWYDSLSHSAAAEYYIRTGDTSVLDNLKFYADYCYEVEAGGGWGHGYPGNGYPDPGYVFGGLVNACGGQVFISLCLARECGIEMEDADFEKTLRYFYRYACVAAPEYGDHRPGDGGGHNGKTSQVGVGISLLNEPYHSAGRFVATQDALNVNQFEGGHTGNYPNVLWRGISLGLVPDEREDAYRYALNHMRWYLELCRSYDGSFHLLPAYEESRYIDNNWGLMIPFYYLSGRNTLRMTGAPPTEHSVIREVPEVMPKHADFSLLDHAEGYTENDFPYTLTANVSGMGDLGVIEKGMRHWHPVVRFNASRSIGNKATSANLSPLNDDADPDNDLTDPAVDIIVDALESDDARVRTAGLMGITGLEGFWPGEVSDFNYDEDDYRRMAPYVEAILDRDEICHWELDGAIWALAVMPQDIKLANLDHIIEILNYEPNWWPRFAALRAFRGLPADVQAGYALQILEAYLTEEHSWQRVALSSAVRGVIADGSQYFQNGERETILQILGEDLAGGIHPRPYAYQQDYRYNLDADTLGAILGAYEYTEFEQIADELNVFFTRTSNPAERLYRGGQLILSDLVEYFETINISDPTVLENLTPIMPGIKAMSIGEVSGIYIQDNLIWQSYARDWQEMVDLSLENFQTIYGDIDLVPNYAFEVDPPQIGWDMPFPDTQAQLINFEFEKATGTEVFNHGMRGHESPGTLSSDTGWSATPVAPRSTASLNANLAHLSANNPDKGPSDVTISCWMHLDGNLPDEDAHYVAFSALEGFDLGVRRMQINGAWTNTLFFDSSLWPNDQGPLYGLNDTSGQPDMMLESGKDYFIMFEGIKDEEINLTLLHLYDPEENRWLTSDGGQLTRDEEKFVSGELTVGIGSLDADVLDPTTRFPGLIDNAQIWTGTTPLTPSEKLTLAMKGSITDVGLQPWVYLREPQNVDAVSAEIECLLAGNAPAGSSLTLYYGLTDAGANSATWDHAITIQQGAQTVLKEGTYNQLLEDLTPNSTYYLRAHAQNPTGAMLEYWSTRPIIIQTLPVDGDVTAPVADVGVDRLIRDTNDDGFELVTLDAGASTDDFGIQTYTWKDAQGNVLYSGPNDTFQLELARGSYLFTLTTTDFNNNSSEDEYYVYVMDDSGPDANAGPDQTLVDYNGNGLRLTYLDSTIDAAAVSTSWILEDQVVSPSADFTINLPVGEHVLILTATAADGSSKSDAVRVDVLSEAQAITQWTLLAPEAIPAQSILAAQDFSEMQESIAEDPLYREYSATDFPVDENHDFWGFSFDRTQSDQTGARIGRFGVTDDKKFKLFSNLYVFYVHWDFVSDPIAISGTVNMNVSMEFARSTNRTPEKHTYARAKAHCTKADGTVEEVTIFDFSTADLGEIDTTVAMAAIPDDTVSLVIKAEGLQVNPEQFHSLDNIVLTGSIVEPPEVIASPIQSGDITGTTAIVSGEVTYNGYRDPNITFLYGSEDKGMTTQGWDHSFEIGPQGSAFSGTLTNLSPGTTYYCRTYADNGAGQVFADPVLQFTTPTTPPILVDHPPSSVTNSSAQLNGEIAETGGDIPNVTFFYGTSNPGETTVGWDESIDLGLQSGSFSYALSGLTANTRYFFRTLATNNEGSTWSAAIPFYTATGQTFISVKNGDWNNLSTWSNGAYPLPDDDNTWQIVDTVQRGSVGNQFLARTLEIGDGNSQDGTLNLETGSGTLYVRDVILNNNGRIRQDKDTNILSGKTLTINGDGGLISPDRLTGSRRMTLDFERFIGSGTVYVYGNKDTGTPNVLFTTSNPIPGTAMQGFTGTIHRDRLNNNGGAIGFDFSITKPTFAIVLADSASDLAPGVSNGSASGILGENGKLHLTSDVDVMIRDLHLYDQALDGTVITDIHLPSGTYTLDTTTNPLAIDLSNVNGVDYSRFFTGGTGTVTVANTAPATALTNWIESNLNTAQQAAYAANPSIDFDGDGMSMIKEFYFGKDPLSHDSGNLTNLTLEDNASMMSYSYERRKNHEGVAIDYELSINLTRWDPLTSYTETTEDTTEGMERVTIEMLTHGDRAFIRIQINEK